MATQYQNLSDYDPEQMPPVERVAEQQFAIAVADWNSNITHVLLEGALQALMDNGAKRENINVVHVPGAFELSYTAKEFANERKDGRLPKYDAVIVLGCVIQGDTPHFDYVCQGVTQGISMLNVQANTSPVIFGLLTVDTMQQAMDRAGGIHGNKGVEAGITAIKMANIVW